MSASVQLTLDTCSAPDSAVDSTPPRLPRGGRQTKVFNTYWRFAAKRQEIFFRRLSGVVPPWSDDPILLEFKFTNAYRASDRVSQYLIRNVIYGSDESPEDTFF